MDRFSQCPFSPVQTCFRRGVDFPFEISGRGVVAVDGDSGCLPRGGVAKIIDAIGRADCEMKVRVCFAKRFGNDKIGISLRRVKDMGEGIIDLVARLGRGRRAEMEVCKMSVHLDENNVDRRFNEILVAEEDPEGNRED